MKFLIFVLVAYSGLAQAGEMTEDLIKLKSKLGVEINQTKENFSCSGDFKLDTDWSSVPKFKNISCIGKEIPSVRVVTDPLNLVSVISFEKPFKQSCSVANLEKYVVGDYERDPSVESDDTMLIIRAKASPLTRGFIFCNPKAKTIKVTLQYPLDNRALGYDDGDGSSCDIFVCIPVKIQGQAEVLQSAVKYGVSKPLTLKGHRQIILNVIKAERKKAETPINPELFKTLSVKDKENFLKLVEIMSKPELWYPWYNTHYGQTIFKEKN